MFSKQYFKEKENSYFNYTKIYEREKEKEMTKYIQYIIRLNVILCILIETIAKCAYVVDYQWITISVLFLGTVYAPSCSKACKPSLRENQMAQK